MHRIIVAIANAATNIANGLAGPSKRVNSEGRPKMPLPMIELITSAVNVHLPIERMKGTRSPSDLAQSIAPKNQRHPRLVDLPPSHPYYPCQWPLRPNLWGKRFP